MSKKKESEVKSTRPPKKSEMQLRVKFTEADILVLARKLAESNAELAQAEDEKKAVMGQLKAKCDGISARVGELSGKINAGYEYRSVKVEVHYDDPKVGMKTTRRLDTDEIVETDSMTLAEMQQDLPLQPEPEAARPLGSVIDIKTATEKTAPRRTSPGGVVVTPGDGDVNDDDDLNKT